MTSIVSLLEHWQDEASSFSPFSTIVREVSHLASAYSPDEFLGHCLDDIHAEWGGRPLCFIVGNLSEGVHLAAARGIDLTEEIIGSNNHFQSPLPTLFAESQGKLVMIDDVFTKEEAASSDFLRRFEERGTVRFSGLIANNDMFFGLYDGVLIFEDKTKSTDEDRVRRQAAPLFNLVRLGLFLSIKAWLQHTGGRAPLLDMTVVDQLGYEYTSSPEFHERIGILDHADDYSLGQYDGAATARGLVGKNRPARILEEKKIDGFGALQILGLYRSDEILRLTEKEIEVAEYISMGISYKAMTSYLNMSVSSVSSHVDRIKKKLDVHSKDEIALLFNGGRNEGR